MTFALADQVWELMKDDPDWSRTHYKPNHSYYPEQMGFLYKRDPTTIDFSIAGYYPYITGRFTDDVALVFRLMKTASYTSLERIDICQENRNVRTNVIVYYRFKPHEFRMIQLLAEPPVPKDILRHIYEFIKK